MEGVIENAVAAVAGQPSLPRNLKTIGQRFSLLLAFVFDDT